MAIKHKFTSLIPDGEDDTLVRPSDWNAEHGTDGVLVPNLNADLLDGYHVSALLYTHPNHSGEVTSVGGGAQTITDRAVTYAKIQYVSAADKILGRATAGAGIVEEINCTIAGRNLIGAADAAAQRATLNLGTLATLEIVPVVNGGTGAITLTGLLQGNGVGAITGIVGTANQLLKRNAGNTAYEFFTPSFAMSGENTDITKLTAVSEVHSPAVLLLSSGSGKSIIEDVNITSTTLYANPGIKIQGYTGAAYQTVLDGTKINAAGNMDLYLVESGGGKVGIGGTTEFKLTLGKGATTPDAGILAIGTFIEGGPYSGTVLTTTGAGTRMIWYPRKASFRAGRVDDGRWDDANIGEASTAFGLCTRASGDLGATAMGRLSVASGAHGAMALGFAVTASGHEGALATGYETVASGYTSTAMGHHITVSGNNSFGIGLDTTYRTLSQANTFAIMGGNIGFGTMDQFGGGTKVIGIGNATVEPSSNPTGGGVCYVFGGALKYRGSSGTVTTIAPA